MALRLPRWAAVLLVIAGACGGNVKTIPPVLEGYSLLGDTLWSVPVPVQGGRERVSRLQEARERLTHAPGNFDAAYDVARYTADLGRYSRAIQLFGEASGLGGLNPRPYARRGELNLLLRRVDRAWSDLRTAERIYTGEQMTEQQVVGNGEMVERSFGYMIPNLLGVTSIVRGDRTRALEYVNASAAHVESLRDAIHVTLWFRAVQTKADFPATLPSRFRAATTSMLLNSTQRGNTATCPVVSGTLVDADLLCYVHGARLLATGKREEAVAAFNLIQSRSHWSSVSHLAAEAALARLQGEEEAAGSADRW